MIAYSTRADGGHAVPVYAVPVLVKREQPDSRPSTEYNRYKNLANECREHFAHQAAALNQMRDAMQTAQHMITVLRQELQVSRAYASTLEQRVTLLEASMSLSSMVVGRNCGEVNKLAVSGDHLNTMLTSVLSCIEDDKFMSKEKEMLSLLEDA
jgi:hypothetical protein